MAAEKLLAEYYQALAGHFGPMRWWPGESPFEIAVGAVLTQNTNWKNVEKALGLLKAKGRLTPGLLSALSQAELEEAVRPSGFYNVKAKRLRNLLDFFARKAGAPERLAQVSLAFLEDTDTAVLRKELLAVKGIGQETADAILLYALQRPVFVVDAYTWRLLTRHGLVPEEADYAEMQAFFQDHLAPDVELYNEYHALIVRLGQCYCRKKQPLCATCPLGRFMEYPL